jgi:hypothetical protein
MWFSQREVQGAKSMTIQEALSKAVEGGYQHDSQHRELGMRAGVLGLHTFSTMHVDECFLDPRVLACARSYTGVAARARLAGAVATLY